MDETWSKKRRTSLLYDRYIAYILIFYVLGTLIKALLVPVRTECEIHEQNIGIRLEPVLALNMLAAAVNLYMFLAALNCSVAKEKAIQL
jgi:hypothetical protein